MEIKLTKNGVTGTLKVTDFEHRTSKKCEWRKCITLISETGYWITPCVQFRPNAHKKALKHYLSDGWKVI